MGSGKSHISRFFSLLNVPVYNADERAKDCYERDLDVRVAVKNLLGEEAYLSDGSLQRQFVANRVFKDSALLRKLEGIIHPAVARDFSKWVKAQDSPYALKEAAILFETGGDQFLDGTVVVLSPDSLRMERIQKRDGLNPDEINLRWARQWDQSKLAERATFCIQNNERDLLSPQILTIHERIQSGGV